MALALKEIHPISHATERQLVLAVREGDDRAFEQLFSRYRRRIGAYVYSLLNDQGRAEDITQEVFISALRCLRETQRPISFKPWIYEIARNACIDEFRRVRRASLVSLGLELERHGTVPLQLADDATPEVRWERKQQLGDLFGAFSSLPDNQHKALVLRELEGLSYGEIGARMGMTRPMVESTLFRARRRLTQEYEELASGRRCLDVQAAVARPDSRGLAALGIRERRRIVGHLHHCSDCLRHARLAGIDDSALRVPGPARRVAALLPFGWLRLAWHRAGAKLSGHGGRTVQRASALGFETPQAAAVARAAAAAAALLITGGGFTALSQGHSQSTRPSSPAPGPVLASSPTRANHIIGQAPHVLAPRSGSSSNGHGPAKRQAARRHETRSAASARNAARSAGGTPTPGAQSAGAPPSSAPASAKAPGAPASSRPSSSGRITRVLHTVPGAGPVSKIISKGTSTAGGVVSRVTGVTGGLPGALPPVPPLSVPLPTGGTVQAPSLPAVTAPSTAGSGLPGLKTPRP